MAYTYDNLRLEKGMYGEAGRSFSQVLDFCTRAVRIMEFFRILVQYVFLLF